MFKDFLSNGSLFDLPVIAMLMFVAFFLAVLVRVCQRSRRRRSDHMATLPLDEDTGERSQS